ncbi:ATP-binding protein [Brevibacillus sp. GCM10020057]|uniref:ATP-binding protein n=1 Tax=Brevibacillus sp. GCM10020057 TaxID=3317327 RepID=UPI003643268A
MRIDELQLKGFGKWQGETFRFAPGINVLAAPNEAGKSTLLQGIFAALYGMKRDYVKSARYLPEYEKYRPWHAAEYETIITYELAGRSYRLHRLLQKEREQARIFLDPDWTELTDVYLEDRRRERNFLEKHLGLTRSLFTDITWIRREPLSAAEHLVPSLANAAKENPLVHAMLAELDRELAAIGKKERAENTLLGKAGALVAQKEAELANARAAWELVSQLTYRIAGWESERQGLEQQLARLQQRQQRASSKEAAWQERWQKSHTPPEAERDWQWWEERALSPQERQVHEEARLALARLQAGQKAPDSEQKPSVEGEKLQADFARGTQLRKRREELQLQLSRLAAYTLTTDAGRQTRGQRKAGQPRRALRLWGIFGLLAALGLVAGIADQSALAAILFGLAAVMAGAAWWKGRTVSPATVQTSSPMAEEWQRGQQELDDLDAQLKQLLRVWGAKDWDEFAAIRDELLSELRDRESNELRAQLALQEQEALICKRWGEQMRVLLERERKELIREQDAWQAERQRIEERLVYVREQLARANGELAAHEGVSVAKAKGEHEEAMANLAQLQRRREALQVARDTLQEALADWNRDISPELNRQASLVFAEITGGAYRDVRLDPQGGFAIRVLEPARQLVLEQEQCSTGTQDQLYLAQRLALHDHVSRQSEPLPLFFDDHFVHYDDVRLRRTLDYLAKLSQTHQLFLFTCQERELQMLEPLLRASSRHLVHSLG